MAEREGFEPSVPLAEHDDLANRCLRPLGHLSKKRPLGHLSKKDNDANASNRPIHYQTHPPAVKQNLLAEVGKKQRTVKTLGEARNVSGSIGRSAALPLTAPAALRFAPCRFSESHPSPRRGVLFSVLCSLFSGAAKPPLWRDSVEIPRAARPTGAMEPAGFPRQTVFAVKLPQTLLGQDVGRETVARKRKVESPSGRGKLRVTVPSSFGVSVTVSGAARGCEPSRLCGAMA